MRFHSPDYFVNQIKTLNKNNINFFYISDDTFTLKKDLVISVCKELVEEGLPISWNAISRVDKVDEDILYWMRKAGCIQISYGVESGCEDTRSLLNKNMATDDILRAFELTTRFGILSRAYFIYGCPGEGPKVLDANIRLMDAINPLGAIFYILDMFPGTQLYQAYLKRNNLTHDIWLERKEDIMYWETDVDLDKTLITQTGDALRNHFHENLPNYVSRINLVDDPSLAKEHGDFLSRLGMTFTVGDYSKDDRILNAINIGKDLFNQALTYHPDPKAYLGLGLVHQKSRSFQGSVAILQQGLDRYPNDAQIRLCLGTSLMNLGKFSLAMECFQPISHLEQARQLMEQCRSSQ